MKNLIFVALFTLSIFFIISCSNNDFDDGINNKREDRSTNILRFTYNGENYSSASTFDQKGNIILDDKEINFLYQKIINLPELITYKSIEGEYIFFENQLNFNDHFDQTLLRSTSATSSRNTSRGESTSSDRGNSNGSTSEPSDYTYTHRVGNKTYLVKVHVDKTLGKRYYTVKGTSSETKTKVKENEVVYLIYDPNVADWEKSFLGHNIRTYSDIYEFSYTQSVPVSEKQPKLTIDLEQSGAGWVKLGNPNNQKRGVRQNVSVITSRSGQMYQYIYTTYVYFIRSYDGKLHNDYCPVNIDDVSITYTVDF
ncbi:hypothetical protein [Dysgonomonas macrotermitis]|uniref:DUF4595 domain-containing protein n=1 Tax=Dysgonomonas macrotermitis TaxID=1346286 RepID=A0A1M4U030_9BACT|nr:hypothetical protein [Dysgonomonas macrotermitis]SHE50131.1 hypothetical protein SAMN05444362_101470 [Dysgonomonas macrotermitis]